MDLAIPEDLPPVAVARLVALRQELEEGDVTEKGYRKHYDQIIQQYRGGSAHGVHGVHSMHSMQSLHSLHSMHSFTSAPSTQNMHPERGHARRTSGYDGTQVPDSPIARHSVHSARSLQSAQSMYDMNSVYAGSSVSGVPDLSQIGEVQAPLPPRGIPEHTNTDPLNVRFRLSTFDNLPSILRHRGKTNGDIVAFQRIDEKGKEAQSITWGKLATKSEKVAQILIEQDKLFRGDRVILMYSYNEPIEFVIAMMGCFLAGLVAVPVSPEHILRFLLPILDKAQARTVLTSESVLKKLVKLPIYTQLSTVTFHKTSDISSFKGTLPPLQVPDLAYIEFLNSSSGDLKGVVVSHRTILHQMRCLMALTQSEKSGKKRKHTVDNVLCSLDVRRSTGMILGVLLTVYAGNSVSFFAPSCMATPGLYAHVASRLKSTILLSDYPALKGVCYNYQTNPSATRNFVKRSEPSLQRVRWCLVDVPVIDPEFLGVLTDRWLKPLGNRDSKSVVAPMLTLSEHGGMVISTTDFLTPNGGFSEVRISKEALARNVIEFTTGEDALAVSSFGYPVPDATVAIVDPDTRVLCASDKVGEIWIDAPSLSGGIWANYEETERTFHAKCYDREGELTTSFLRTDLLGFLKEGKLYVLGTRADRLLNMVNNQKRYCYSKQLLETLLRSVPEVYDACIFQIPRLSTRSSMVVNVVLLESPKAPAAPLRQPVLLDNMAARTMQVLKDDHQFPVYACLLCSPGLAPRTIRSGRPDIAKIASKRLFLAGKLAAAYIRFDFQNYCAGQEFPRGEDVKGGIWNYAVSKVRNSQLENCGNDKQYSGVDMRTNVRDDRMAESLDNFSSLVELLQWRVRKQPDELAYKSVGSSAIVKDTSWRQLGIRISAVHNYITKHLALRPGHVAGLIYTQSEDFVHAIYACMLAGVTIVPLSPIDLTKLEEDVPLLIKAIKQFKINAFLGNTNTHGMMEDKQLQQYLKSRQFILPKLHNTSKAKTTDECRAFSVIKIPPQSAKGTCLIWVYTNADHDFTASFFGHQQLMGMCKIQKETCQMSATRPIVGSIRSVSGLGFLYSFCLGVYTGCFTLLMSPVDFANNPALYFIVASQYKIKDGYATPQMLSHASKRLVKPKGFDLSELQNLIVPLSGRADSEIVSRTRVTFANVNLDAVSINISYGPVCNPMVTTRSYMLVENIDLWLDPVALREGRVSLVNPNNTTQTLHLVDSGMVPINTQVAIVNPETLCLCRTGEIGEIWVVSEGNQFAQAKENMAPGKYIPGLLETIADGEPGIKYMRTGDLGFLHTVTRGPGLEMQVLFVVGSLRNTFEVNGLQYFAEDVESTIVNAHSMIDDCIVAVCGGVVCALVETHAHPKYLCSLTAVIAQAVAQDHQFALNVVSFLSKGGIPRSRLGEKQRKTMLRLYTGTKRLGATPFKTLMDFTVNPVSI